MNQSLSLQQNPNRVKVVGLDPSLRNWGVSIGSLDLDVGIESLQIHDLYVIQPTLPKGKIRQNSLDILSASQLYFGAQEHIQDAFAVFAEVPVGSQSARAMVSYGVCVGVLGALKNEGIPLIELSPNQIKKVVGIKDASKSEMILWASGAHPEAPWPTINRLGQAKIVEGKAEHMADATAAIYAGVASQEFQELIRLHKVR